MKRLGWLLAGLLPASLAAQEQSARLWTGDLSCGERTVAIAYLADGEHRFYASDDGQRRTVRGWDPAGAWFYDVASNLFTRGDPSAAAWVQSHDFGLLATAPEALYRPGQRFPIDAAGRQVRPERDGKGRVKTVRLVAGEAPMRLHMHWKGQRLEAVSFEPPGGCSRLEFNSMRELPASPQADGHPRPAALLRWHGLHRLAHLAGLPWLMSAPIRDALEERRGDDVTQYFRDAVETRFAAYFSGPAIRHWADCQAPRFSQDGELMVKQVHKWVQVGDGPGQRFAWIEHWEQRDRRWWQRAVINLEPPVEDACPAPVSAEAGQP